MDGDEEREPVPLSPGVEAAHEVDGLPLVVRVAAVEFVERVDHDERVAATLERLFHRGDVARIGVEGEAVGDADVVDVVAVLEPRLPKPALHRGEPLLGVEDERAPARSLPLQEVIFGGDGADDCERHRRLSLPRMAADDDPLAADDGGPEQLLVCDRVGKRAELAGR